MPWANHPSPSRPAPRTDRSKPERWSSGQRPPRAPRIAISSGQPTIGQIAPLPSGSLMLLRVLVTSLLALVISPLTVLTPTSTGASPVTRETSMRPDAVTGNVTRARVVRLDRPAENVVAYWHGSPHAAVRLAFSTDGRSFGPAEDAGRDEIGRARKDGTTYGALHAAKRGGGRARDHGPPGRTSHRARTVGRVDDPVAEPAQLGGPAFCCRARPRPSRRSSRGAPGVRIRRT